MSDKHSALAQARAEFDWWEATVSGLSDAQLTAPQLDDNWSIKDVVVHLHAWQQRSVARFEAALGHTEPAYPAWPFDPDIEEQLHDLNGWLYAQSRDTPWPEVYRSWRACFLRLLELGAATPEADLLKPGTYTWLDGYALVEVLEGTTEHHHEHAEYLAPVLARIAQPEA